MKYSLYQSAMQKDRVSELLDTVVKFYSENNLLTEIHDRYYFHDCTWYDGEVIEFGPKLLYQINILITNVNTFFIIFDILKTFCSDHYINDLVHDIVYKKANIIPRINKSIKINYTTDELTSYMLERLYFCNPTLSVSGDIYHKFPSNDPRIKRALNRKLITRDIVGGQCHEITTARKFADCVFVTLLVSEEKLFRLQCIDGINLRRVIYIELKSTRTALRQELCEWIF